jgi:hypothetical protein
MSDYKMTQCEKIMRHLERYGSITSVEAMSEYGIARLASRINDLKKSGVPIKKRMPCPRTASMSR